MRKATRLLAPWLIAAPALAAAAEAPTDAGPALWLNAESLRLHGGEAMGWLGGELLFDGGGGWMVGPAVYGAASGRRGGLFVTGLSLRRQWALPQGFGLSAGVLAAAGGGADAPVGSGLVWRPSLTLLRSITPALDAGLSWSWVDFPDGRIRSSQWGLSLAWQTKASRSADAAAEQAMARPAWAVDQMQATAGQYHFADGSGRGMGLVGARLAKQAHDAPLGWGIEAEAAVSGDAAGYMAILGTLDLGQPISPATRVGLRLGAGLGGGGAVPTGGGGIAKAALLVETQFVPGWSAGLAWGRLRGLDGPFDARLLQAWVGTQLDAGGGRAASGTEWALTLRRYLHVQRHAGGSPSLDTVGLRLAHALDEHWYLGGEANSAFAGQAGAFGIGLVGLGWATDALRPHEGWQAGGELMAGAAGGGGVAAAGGALVQTSAWLSWPGLGRGRWRVAAGRAESLREGFASPLVDIAWTRRFGGI